MKFSRRHGAAGVENIIAILPEPICQRLDKATLRWLPLEARSPAGGGYDLARGVYLSHSARA